MTHRTLAPAHPCMGNEVNSVTITVPGDSTLRLHPLTMVPDGDDVVVGRADTASYAVFPDAGARMLRMLAAGSSIREATAWYEEEVGESLDVADFIATLADLGFLLRDGEPVSVAAPVRWQRLGRWMFSWPAMACYAALTVAALIAMSARPELRPSYQHIFFTSYISLLPVVGLAITIPTILFHESFHALAGRRLGLPSQLGIGRRFYFIVAETRMDTLLSVERKRRYLPFLAGMLADAILVSAFTLLADALDVGSVPTWCHKVCLFIAFTCVMRLLWQFLFFLETDLYYVVTNAFRCSDLQNATRHYLRERFGRYLGLRARADSVLDWSDRDQAMARRYAPILVAGYSVTAFNLAWVGVPAALRMWSTLSARFTTRPGPAYGLLDAVLFLTMGSLQLSFLLYIAIRDRRAGSTQDPSLAGGIP